MAKLDVTVHGLALQQGADLPQLLTVQHGLLTQHERSLEQKWLPPGQPTRYGKQMVQPFSFIRLSLESSMCSLKVSEGSSPHSDIWITTQCEDLRSTMGGLADE
jgi:hypothetical protein